MANSATAAPLTASELRDASATLKAWARVHEHEPKDALTTLVTKGCDPQPLLLLLGFIASSPDRVDKRRGFGRNFKTVIKRMRQCAEDARRLNDTTIGLMFSSRLSAETRTHISVLPVTLRVYSDALEMLSQSMSARQPITRDHVIALVVCHVQERTGRPHDAEVSALISAALDNPSYSLQAHKAWRTKNRKLVSALQAEAVLLPQLALPKR